jgi:hypothetical protein
MRIDNKLLDLEFHHLGLAVKSAEPAKTFLQAIAYNIGHAVRDSLQNVDLILCRHVYMPSIEIISRVGESGPLDRMLAKHSSGLIYHQCYMTRDLLGTLDVLETDLGLRVVCLSDAKPAVLFEGRMVSFYQIEGFGMIEVLERT